MPLGYDPGCRGILQPTFSERLRGKMTKGVMNRLGLAASRRVKRLQVSAEKAADELLQKSYQGTAEQTLRGAETVSKILREEDEDIAKAKSAMGGKAATKKAAKSAKRIRPKRSTRKPVKRKSR
jgi:hypothetical protein